MSLIKTIVERKKISELIRSLMESSFYLEMDIRERLALVKVMISGLS
jgi:ERCC4-type nuclease